MKKPKITEGEWRRAEIENQQWKRDSDEFILTDKSTVICDVISAEYTFESQANAKAISAVPEMIDALINLVKAIDKLPPLTAIEGSLEQEYKDAIKALKKAGYDT